MRPTLDDQLDILFCALASAELQADETASSARPGSTTRDDIEQIWYELRRLMERVRKLTSQRALA